MKDIIESYKKAVNTRNGKNIKEDYNCYKSKVCICKPIERVNLIIDDIANLSNSITEEQLNELVNFSNFNGYPIYSEDNIGIVLEFINNVIISSI